MKKEIKKTNGKSIKKTKGKHKKKALRVLVYIVLIAFVLSILFLIGYGVYYFSTSSKYTVKKVDFFGNEKYTVDDLNNKAAIKMGENIFKISKREISKNLNELPYIKKVDISRKLPTTLKITVTEYTSKYFAYNIEDDNYYRISDDFVILEKTNGESKTDNEVLLFGISFDDKVTLKKKLPLTEINKIEQYEKIYDEYMKKDIGKAITSVEFKDSNTILTLDFELNVIMDENDIEYNIGFLKSIINNLTSKSGTIDMTKPNPVYTSSIM